MGIHKNARLTPRARERLAKIVLSGQMPQAASEAAGGGARRSFVKRSALVLVVPTHDSTDDSTSASLISIV